ncbi:MAG: TetR/AcrR family transcriptional regulator [Pseudomonadota bacterium]
MKAFKAAFLKRGFDGTTTQQVLAETGLSKGALYHHFKSKTEVMEAIYEAEARRAIGLAAERAQGEASPLDRLRSACIAWMGEARSPSVSKILFEIGPTALGRRRAKEIEDAISLRLIERLLREAIRTGEIKTREPALIAAMINALVAEASLHALRTGRNAEATLEGALNALFASLRSQ